MHIYILLTIILKAKVLSWILNQKVFCFGFALWGGGKGNSSCPVWKGIRSSLDLLTPLWETKKNGNGGQAKQMVIPL